MSNELVTVKPYLTFWVGIVSLPSGFSYQKSYYEKPTNEQVLMDWQRPISRKHFRVVG